jgi:hypothetical protein
MKTNMCEIAQFVCAYSHVCYNLFKIAHRPKNQLNHYKPTVKEVVAQFGTIFACLFIEAPLKNEALILAL